MEATIKLYPKKPLQIYWFAGCVNSLIDYRSDQDAKLLLKRQSLQVLTPHMKCCGRSFFNIGHTPQAISLAHHALRAFRNDAPVVSLSIECVNFLRLHLPQLLLDTTHYPQATALAARVFHWADFMWHVCKPRWTDKGEPTKIMLHTSCEECTSSHTKTSSSLLLQSLKNVSVDTLPTNGECCGANPMLLKTTQDSSTALMHRTTRTIFAEQPNVLVGNQLSCINAIERQLQHRGCDTKVASLPTFLRNRVI